MAEFGWVLTETGPYTYRLIADDVTGEPIRFELTCSVPVTITVRLSRGNSQNLFERSMTFQPGTTVIDIPNNIRNRIRCIEDAAGDALLHVF